MNVLNRNMFRNRDSRNRLAQMGGILSSSPELQETAMTFANGGGADLPDYIINVPGLTAEGEYLRISSATLEKLNNAVPEIMANARMVSPVEMVISEGFSSLVANARPGDAVVGTRVNRLREQRATETDPSRVPMPPEIAQVSSPEDVFAGATRNNLRNPNTTPYSETEQRIKADEVRRAEAALIESLAPNNAQGQPGGILGAKYPEGRGSYSTSIAEALLNNDPFSGELSPSQTARNQETLRNTLRREEIAQQREDSTEAGRIMRDAADTRKAFSVPLEEPASLRENIREQLAGTYSTNLAGGTDESSLETLIRENMAASQAQDGTTLESGIAKAVPTEPMFVASEGKFFKDGKGSLTEQAAGSVSDRLKFMLEQDKLAQQLQAETESTEMTQDAAVLSSAGDAIREALTNKTGSEELMDLTAQKAGAENYLARQTKNAFFDSMVPPSTANELDDLFKKTIASQQEGTPGGSLPEDGTANYLTPESMAQAQRINVGSVPYLLDRATGKAYRADGAPITAAEQGTVDKFLATEQGTSQLSAVTEADAVAKKAKIASVQQALIRAVQSNDVEGQIALREELKEAKEPTVKVEPEALVTEREAGELDKLSAEMADRQRTEFQQERELEGDREAISPPAPKDATPQGPRPFTSKIIEPKNTSPETLAAITKSLQENQGAADAERGVPAPPSDEVITSLKTTAAEAGSAGVVGDGSIADLTKGYVKLLKDLLGESDEDKAARKGELFMLMGAALMSGKSSNALTNIGNALQIGAKAAIQDRATRKKREDTIGLKGFEMAADRIAKRDAAQLALDKEGRDKKTQLEIIDARLVATNDAARFRFDLENAGYKKMGEYTGLGRIFKTAQDGFTNEGIKKPKDITLLEYFEKLARDSNYSQAQINRYNTYFGINPSSVKGDKSGPSKAEKDLYEKDS